jgi:DNA-directed RNA polymerase subunit alpha
MRRVLLNSLPGAAVTAVQIGGVQHEYSTLPHVQEDMIDFLLNVKSLRLRSLTGRPAVLRLEITGRTGPVTAADLLPSGEYEVVNPKLVLLHVDSADADISIEFHAETGVGFKPAQNQDEQVIGRLPVDALFTPIRRANYEVEATRVGQVTDFDRLVLEVWTDNTMTPQKAVQQAADIILQHMNPFISLGRLVGIEPEHPEGSRAVFGPMGSMQVEELKLSSRTQNSLRRGNLDTVGDVLERSAEELMNLRNFGERSIDELFEKLREIGVAIPDSDGDRQWRKDPIAALFDQESGGPLAASESPAAEASSPEEADIPAVYSTDSETAENEEEIVNLDGFARRTFEPDDEDDD